MVSEQELRQAIDDASRNDYDALAKLFGQQRERLRRMIRLRMDPRLYNRIDDSDVLQDTYVSVQGRLSEYDPSSMPWFVWLRLIAGQKLIDLHRRHLGIQKRSLTREVSIHRASTPDASSACLAAAIVDNMQTPGTVATQRDVMAKVMSAIETLNETDREIISLRHFEQLTNSETAIILDISENAASNRYVRALRHLKNLIDTQLQ